MCVQTQTHTRVPVGVCVCLCLQIKYTLIQPARGPVCTHVHAAASEALPNEEKMTEIMAITTVLSDKRRACVYDTETKGDVDLAIVRQKTTTPELFTKIYRRGGCR